MVLFQSIRSFRKHNISTDFQDIQTQSASQKNKTFIKPNLNGREIINELKEIGFNFKLVLADSLYGESDNFIEALNHHQLSFVVAIVVIIVS